MEFTKMHLNGNDLVIINNIENSIPEDFPELASRTCRRNRGVGCNNIIIISKSQKADISIKVFKPDGSESRTSAAGILCAAKYCYDNNIVRLRGFRIETKAQTVKVKIEDDTVEADLGEPILEASRIPSTLDKEKFINEQLKLKDRIIRATCLSIEDPHCVVFVDKLHQFNVSEVGPIIENHGEFPKKVNVQFVEINNDKEITIRPWQRGIGEVLSAGTGACAALAAAVLNKKTGKKITVHTKGGDEEVEWKEDNHIILRASPEYIFKGEI